MPNTQGRHGSPLIALRELALVMHCLPHGRARISLDDGRRVYVGQDLDAGVGRHPGSVLSPCHLRRAVSAVAAGTIEPGWVDTIETLDLVSPRCRHLGAGLYAAWCAGVAIHAFTSELSTTVLQLAFAALPEPSSQTADHLGVRLVGAADLGLTLVTVETQARDGSSTMASRGFARDLQSLVLVTELEMATRAFDTRPER